MTARSEPPGSAGGPPINLAHIPYAEPAEGEPPERASGSARTARRRRRMRRIATVPLGLRGPRQANCRVRIGAEGDGLVIEPNEAAIGSFWAVGCVAWTVLGIAAGVISIGLSESGAGGGDQTYVPVAIVTVWGIAVALGAAVTVALKLGHRYVLPRYVLDRGSGQLRYLSRDAWRWRSGPLDRVAAVQCLLCRSVPDPTRNRPGGVYELNLVIDNGKRLNLARHGDRDWMRRTAEEIAAFLDVGLQDRLDEPERAADEERRR